MNSIAQPLLVSSPVVAVEQIDNRDANRLLVEWEHKLGPCERPFHTDSYALFVAQEPIAVAMSCSIVHGPVAGYVTQNVVELARLAASNKWANRVMIRLWREVYAPTFCGWNVQAAVSYSHNALHGGNTYRTDGWRKVTDKAGSTGKGGNWGRRGRGYADETKHGLKTLWIWEFVKASDSSKAEGQKEGSLKGEV